MKAIFVRQSVTQFLSSGSLAAILVCGIDPAGAESLTAHYSVKLIGLSLGTASITTNVDAASYQVEANAKLTGLATMVSNSRGAATASGLIAQGRVAPNGYATTSSNSKMTRTIRIGMTSGTVRAAEISPPFEERPGRVPIGDGHKRGIIDPLSALVMPVPGSGAVVGPEACNRTIPVFDGWTRFDVTLRYVGTRNVAAKGYQGPVAVCAARYVPVAGHRPDQPGTKFMAENKSMEVWLAPVGASRIVMPWRISVATMVGTTVIEATEFSAGGAQAAQR
jgi:hypothetical protein